MKSHYLIIDGSLIVRLSIQLSKLSFSHLTSEASEEILRQIFLKLLSQCPVGYVYKIGRTCFNLCVKCDEISESFSVGKLTSVSPFWLK